MRIRRGSSRASRLGVRSRLVQRANRMPPANFFCSHQSFPGRAIAATGLAPGSKLGSVTQRNLLIPSRFSVVAYGNARNMRVYIKDMERIGRNAFRSINVWADLYGQIGIALIVAAQRVYG